MPNKKPIQLNYALNTEMVYERLEEVDHGLGMLQKLKDTPEEAIVSTTRSVEDTRPARHYSCVCRPCWTFHSIS